MYQIKRVAIGKTPQLDALAHACGEVSTATLVSFWRTVRKKGIWLNPKHLMRWHTSTKLHAHTADACVQAFFASLKSWRKRRKADPSAKPPRRRKWYFRVEYKHSAMSMKENTLLLSMARATNRCGLIGPGPSRKPSSFTGPADSTRAIATYEPCCFPVPETGNKIAGID